MVYALIQELGSLSSWYDTFITRRTATPHVPRLMPTPWTKSSSADPLPQTPFMTTIHVISVPTNLTVTELTHTASLHLSIP
jgi:hypothetical protein